MSTYVTANPTTGQTEREFPALTDDEVAQLGARSAAAFDQWRNTTAEERAATLRRTAELYEKLSLIHI